MLYCSDCFCAMRSVKHLQVYSEKGLSWWVTRKDTGLLLGRRGGARSAATFSGVVSMSPLHLQHRRSLQLLSGRIGREVCSIDVRVLLCRWFMIWFGPVKPCVKNSHTRSALSVARLVAGHRWVPEQEELG